MIPFDTLRSNPPHTGLCKETNTASRLVLQVLTRLDFPNVCLWTFTMTEAWAWCRGPEELAACSGLPWDGPSRRPSHADKRHALLDEEIRAVLRPGVTEAEIQATDDRLLSLAA